MKPILTADEFRAVDKAYSGDLTLAMDRAGYAVAMAAARRGAGYGSSVVVLAGPGNNGGDGYVAARYLKLRGAAVVVHAWGEPSTPEAKDAAAKALAGGVPIVPLVGVTDADYVVDALFGGGVRHPIPDELKRWMATSATVIAVDFPTGLDPNTGKVDDAAFAAVETVTFSTLKTGHMRGSGPDHCGDVTVVDIGINGGKPSMYLAELEDAIRPGRDRTAHKWSAGSVLVVGGSVGMAGAAVLAGRSALRFGAGAVVVAAPDVGLVNSLAPDLVCVSVDQAPADLDRFDVVLVGPGLADRDSHEVEPILAEAEHVVLDAGGLQPELLEIATGKDAKLVATPHLAEFSRVSGGLGGGAYATRAFASHHSITVLLKGNPTLVTDGCPPVLVNTGGPELATFGTGDVLAGMLAALWARGLEPMDAAVSAAYWHGVAGAAAAESGSLTAGDLLVRVGAYAW